MDWSDQSPKFVQLLVGIVAFVVVVGGIMLLLDLLPKLSAALFRRGTAVPERPPEPPEGGAPAPTTAAGGVSTQRRPSSELWIALGFLAPALVLVFIGLVVPVFRTIWLSLQDATGRNSVGLENYGWMFDQPAIRNVLLNTLIWVILAPLIATTVGLLFGILIDRARWEAGAKSLIFLPMAISFVGATIIWRFMYEAKPENAEQIGLLNQVMVWVGIGPQQFILLRGWHVNTLMLILIMIWVQTGFAMVILSAAIKAIPTEIVEAARMDGTNPWQMFWRVTLPVIKPTVIVVVVTISIITLKVFDIIRTMTGGRFDTSVIANEMYNQAFIQGQLGRGSALAAFLFLLVLPLVVYQVRILRQRRLEGAR